MRVEGLRKIYRIEDVKITASVTNTGKAYVHCFLIGTDPVTGRRAPREPGCYGGGWPSIWRGPDHIEVQVYPPSLWDRISRKPLGFRMAKAIKRIRHAAEEEIEKRQGYRARVAEIEAFQLGSN